MPNRLLKSARTVVLPEIHLHIKASADTCFSNTNSKIIPQFFFQHWVIVFSSAWLRKMMPLNSSNLIKFV